MHKKGEEVYFSLGGKIEKGETELQCLEREVWEEAGCKVINTIFFESFEGLTHDSKKTLRLSCYFVELVGEPKVSPADQINGFVWVDRDYEKNGIVLAGMLHTKIVPELIKRNLL